jgi:flagellin-like hook-associated protein FlgL
MAFASATSNIFQSKNAYQEANSRITDIDVAEESSRLATTQILQQSAQVS